MPIYAYKCTSCGHAKDVLRRMSDDPLTICPACGEATFQKQVTAAGFQLKGSGWYVTDFRGGSNAAVPAAAGGADSAPSKPAESSTPAVAAPAAAPAPPASSPPSAPAKPST